MSKLGFVPVLLLLSACTSTRTAGPAGSASYFVSLKAFNHFARENGPVSETIFISPKIESILDFDQMILSWNPADDRPLGFEFEARAIYSNSPTRWYSLGLWSRVPARFPRESVRQQKDEIAEVQI